MSARSRGELSSSFLRPVMLSYFLFFFNDTPPTEIYTLSLHDALPISQPDLLATIGNVLYNGFVRAYLPKLRDRKSTRLNSSHSSISYAVFCLKKKKQIIILLQSVQVFPFCSTSGEQAAHNRDSRATND